MQHDFILLDRSGSMGSLWKEAINSINEYVKKLADDNVDTGVTLMAFDQGPDGKLDLVKMQDRILPKTWLAVKADGVVTPRGMTPLNDAVGRIVAMAEAGNYDKVAIIIMTDGQENASRELSVAQAKALLDKCRAKNWQVIFLGANFDNVAQATSYGNAAGQTISASAANLVGTMRHTATARASYGMTGQSINYTDEDKKKAAQK